MIQDGLRTEIEALGKINGYRDGPLVGLCHNTALTAYQSSGMLKKVIRIPAEDQVREWRDWQADADEITLIEAEEKRLDLKAKTIQAEVLRRVGGGAFLIVMKNQNHADELNLESVKAGDIASIAVLSRWQLQAEGWHDEITNPLYGTPTMWRLPSASSKAGELIHPSRIIAFRGDPLPAGVAMDMENAFWGDSYMMTVLKDVLRSDDAQRWFAALIRKAKLTRVGIPGLSSMNKEKVARRVGLLASGESTLNATVYETALDKEGASEQITDYQVNFNGIPAMMDAFDQRVAAVSDIPFTRLMGRSPAGMNATGESDNQNWNKMVKVGQELRVRPCLETLDPILLRSAGVSKIDDITWKFAPLDVPNEKEEADTFKVVAEALAVVHGLNAIPEEAFNEAVQNTLIEREYIPGLEQALSKIPESERFGINPEPDDTDPSGLQSRKEGSNVSGSEGEATA